MTTEAAESIRHLMTLPQAAAYVGRTRGYQPNRTTLRTWITRGVGGHLLRATRVGGVWLVHPEHLNLFLDAVERSAFRR